MITIYFSFVVNEQTVSWTSFLDLAYLWTKTSQRMTKNSSHVPRCHAVISVLFAFDVIKNPFKQLNVQTREIDYYCLSLFLFLFYFNLALGTLNYCFFFIIVSWAIIYVIYLIVYLQCHFSQHRVTKTQRNGL